MPSTTVLSEERILNSICSTFGVRAVFQYEGFFLTIADCPCCQDTNVYGPVPTMPTFALPTFLPFLSRKALGTTAPTVVAGTYCHSASGCLSFTVSSRSPVASMLLTLSTKEAR